MIKLITDGALPHPAKCCACGYGGNERFYFWFKYKEKWGQVLICTVCMNEAALLDEVGFTSRKTTDELKAENERLSGLAERFEPAVVNFLAGFADLTGNFTAVLNGGYNPGAAADVSEEPAEPEFAPIAASVEPVEDGDGTLYDDEFKVS